MKRIVNSWSDTNGRLGIVEIEDDTFGTCYHPVLIDSNNNLSFINNLWYTTYNGARQFFRLATNEYWITGRLTKVEKCEELDILEPTYNSQTKMRKTV